MAVKKENNSKRKALLLAEYARQRAENKRLMGKDSTADLYLAATHHFLAYLGGKDIPVRDLTPTLVNDFQSYLQARGLKVNTINSYLSSLRAVYNAAFDEKPFKRAQHPFHKLKLKRDQPVKKPLSGQQLQRLAAADLRDSPELALTADLALFCFMAYGMPFVDLVHLTRRNIRGQSIVYQRHKTGIGIRIEITAAMWQIIRKYESPDSEYLFPFLSAPPRHHQYKAMLYGYNKSLKLVGQLLDIHENLTSYVMRHTWASEARRLHVDIAVISQALGHTNEQTTRGYFNRLDQPELDRANRLVTGPICEILANKPKT